MNKTVCMLFFVGLIAAIASANTIIKPVSVVLTPSGSQYLQNNPAVHWFDGSGLSDATIVETGDTVPAVLPTHTFGYDSGGHMARVRNATGGLAELTFNLGGTYEVGGIILWNNGETGQTDRGIENAAISWSSDGINFTTAETLSFAQSAASGDIGAQHVALNTSLPGVTHIRMAVDNFDPSDAIVSFHEVRMMGSPAPVPETGYPRLLFSNSDIPALKLKVQSGWLQDAFNVMVDNADDYMNVSVTPYAVVGASAGRRLNERVNTLALTGMLLNDYSYIGHAITMCMSAIAQTDVDDYYSLNGHLAIADALHAYAVAYDWLYNYMTPTERTALYDEIIEFMDWVYDSSANGSQGKYEPTPMSSNHNSVHHGALGLAALVISTNTTVELERAASFIEGYYRYARDATGYNSEGIGYYGYGSLGAVPFSVAYERAGYGSLIDDNSKNQRVSDYVLRFVQPWGGSMVALNDSNDLAVGGGMMEFISRYQDRVGLWTWLKMFGPDGDGTYSGPDDTSYTGMGCTIPYVILVADETLQPLSPESAGVSLEKFFDRGTGAFRSSWQDDAALATFTCGPDIHRGHNHRDEGSFTFSAFGEYFVIDPGYDPYMGRAHNCVTVNGVDQDKEPSEYDTYGLMLDTKDFGDAWYMKGDATPSYPDVLNLDHAIRQFMSVKAPQPYIIVSDDIEGVGVNDFSWLLHAGKNSVVTPGSNAGEFYLEGNAAGGAVCYVKFLNPTSGLTFEETDLSGATFQNSLGSPKYFANYFRELSMNYSGVNPRFIAILIAAESMADLPEIETSQTVDGLRVKVRFPNTGIEDQILVTDGDMDFHRLGEVYYLHADMPVGSSPDDTTLWFDDPMVGNSLAALGGSITSNYFNLNGFDLRAPDTTSPVSFDGTLVVGNTDAAEGLLHASDWSVSGFDLDDELVMQPHSASVDLSISSLVLRSIGDMNFRTGSIGNDAVNLSVGHLSGSGTLGFGSTSNANDSNGVWGLAIVDPASDFSGTVELTRGELAFQSSFVLSNATFVINEAEDNHVVLAQDVTFAALEYGSATFNDGVYAASELNSALGTDRFSGSGTLTVIPKSDVFYLQGSMPANDSILDKEYWFDERTAGNAMAASEAFAGNRFDVNRTYWRAPNTSGTAVFDGTLVVGNAGSGLLVHYSGDLQLAGGMELDSHLVVRPHRSSVSLSVSGLSMGPSGELIFRTLINGGSTNKTQSLSVDNLSGSGTVQFGTGAGDAIGEWTFSVSDTTPEFTGTVQLLSGELTFANALSLPDATFKIEPSWDNHVVLANDVEFDRLKFGTATLISGAYTSADLNAVLGTDRFSGPGTLTVNYMQNNFEAWIVEYELTGDDALPTADLEPDGMNNLLEYALGGNPTTDDAGSIMPKGAMINVSGTNWMEYVFNRRTDAEARGLHYTMLVSTNLTEGVWFDIGQTWEFDTATIDSDFESVTNRIPTEDSVLFMTLEVSEE